MVRKKVEKYYVGAYWGIRQESSVSCAERLAGLLKELSGLGAPFEQWHERAGSLDRSLELQIDPSPEAIDFLLRRKGVNKTDVGATPIADLGFGFSAWNGVRKPRAITLAAKCGCYSSDVPVNNTIMRLPVPHEANEMLYDKNLLAGVVAALARHMEPEWAGVVSTAHGEHLGGGGPEVTGWIRYVPSKLLTPEQVASLPCDATEVAGRGWILALAIDHRFTAKRGEDLLAADKLRTALAALGALGEVLDQ